MSRFKLLILDCDGVLVDSERITNTVFAAMLNELGMAVTLDDMFEQFVGHSMPQCLEKVGALLGAAPPADFVAEYRRRCDAALGAELVAVPGIESALDRIRLPCCVASSGDHDKMRTTLGITGLLARFEGRLFSVTEVAAPKPAPDVFLYAAARCGVTPADCVVVEDTPTGVRAAVAAGMTVFGYAALTPAQRLRDAGAHRLFTQMEMLPELLDGMPP